MCMQDGHHYGEYLGLAVADRWQGPFKKVGGYSAGPIIKESNEDPFMWRDKACKLATLIPIHTYPHAPMRMFTLWCGAQVTGMFHALTHTEVKIPQPPMPPSVESRGPSGLPMVQGGSVGGRHIWSEDGERWHSTTAHLALGEHVTLDNGTVWQLSRRERPFVLFEEDGSTPKVVFNGVELAGQAPRVFVLAQSLK